MKKAKKTLTSRKRLPDRASELLVNQRMLEVHRDEIKKEIRSHDRRFDSIDKRFDSIEQKQSSDFLKLVALIEKQSGEISRVVALVEEQRNLNNAVLDGYQSIYDRQDRVEQELGEVKQTLLTLKKV